MFSRCRYRTGEATGARDSLRGCRREPDPLGGGERWLGWQSTHAGVTTMFRTIVEEAAALASLALFLGMIAIWAQVIASL
jgi:hypothetical protein